jgi:ribosome recycling factor
MEEIQMFLDEAKDTMEKALKHTQIELGKIRAGRASVGMLDGLMVDYYGSPTPVNQVASVTAPDARTIMVKPFEKKLIVEIEKAIREADLGVNPQNDGEAIRINIPPLSEERRRDLVKKVKNECETGKVNVRNIRKDTNEDLRKLLKDGAAEDEIKRAEEKVQTLTDNHITRLDNMLAEKEKEIMTV